MADSQCNKLKMAGKNEYQLIIFKMAAFIITYLSPPNISKINRDKAMDDNTPEYDKTNIPLLYLKLTS